MRKTSREQACHPLLKPLINVVKVLGEMLGSEYEIVLHDASRHPSFIVEIFNGELTGRTKSSPLTDFGELLLRSEDYNDVDYIANYSSIAPDGRPMRSSVTLIRDESRQIIGLLCINYDLTQASVLKSMFDFLNTVRSTDVTCGSPEVFEPNPNSQMRRILEEAKRSRGGKPLRYSSKQERIRFLSELEAQGFFAVKGSITAVCKETGKSPYTIYSDLRVIRTAGKKHT